jgi:hypothetical protein
MRFMIGKAGADNCFLQKDSGFPLRIQTGHDVYMEGEVALLGC